MADPKTIKKAFERNQKAVKMRFTDPDHALLAVFSGRPVALAYNKFDEKTRIEVHQEYLDSIAQYKNNHGFDIPGEFVIAKGVKT